ncbi:MAG: zinc-ribbon domain-containing protein, partial [Candidatus Rokubacteria bacterium]|nr:zinc-ribbon domain-containing protein [Candidatus Rokubacteria bacterium]
MAHALASGEAPAAGSASTTAASSGTAAPSAAVLTCTRCHARLERASRFCPECGTALA